MMEGRATPSRFYSPSLILSAMAVLILVLLSSSPLSLHHGDLQDTVLSSTVSVSDSVEIDPEETAFSPWVFVSPDVPVSLTVTNASPSLPHLTGRRPAYLQHAALLL